MKSHKMPYIVYANMESLIKKIDGYANNREKPSTTKIGEHIPCRYSMLTIWAFNNIENKPNLYHVEDCTEKFHESLRKHAKNIIDFKKKKVLPLTKKN